MRTIFLSTTIMLLSILNSFGQNTKKINSLTDNIYGGNAVYEYYEDSETGDYIKHGTFKYTKQEKFDIGSMSVTITGRFNENKMDGTWSYAVYNTDRRNGMGTYTTSSYTSTRNYKDGIPNGLWKAAITSKTRARRFSNGAYVWGAYETPEASTTPVASSASVTFKNGRAIGTVTYTLEGGKAKTLTLNENGFCVGSLQNTNIFEINDIQFNEKGIVIKDITRVNAGNREVQKKFEADKELLENTTKYLNNEISKEELSKMRIKIDTLLYNWNNYGDIFDDVYFDLRSIKGYNQGGSAVKSFGSSIYAQRIQPVPHYQHNKWWLCNGKSIESYQTFLDKYRYEIADPEAVEKLIEDRRQELEKIQRDRELAQEKLNCEKEITQYGQIINEYFSTKEKTFDAKMRYIGNVYKKNMTINVIQSIFGLSGKLQAQFSQLKSTANISYNYKNYVNDCAEQQHKAREKYSKFQTDYIPQLTKIDSTLSLSVQLLNERRKYNEGQQTPIIEQYNEIINLLANQMQDKSIDVAFNLLLQAQQINEKMLLLKDKNCKELVKRIKKSKTLDSKIAIFLEE